MGVGHTDVEFDSATYEEETIRLAPGDWLIVFSDGISEATSAAGEEYGEAQIIACVQRNAALDPSRLLDALFSGTAIASIAVLVGCRLGLRVLENLVPEIFRAFRDY
jgi:hypothetical protein